MIALEKLRQYAGTDRTALVNREERLTYAQLDRRSDAFAAWLLSELGEEDKSPVLLYGQKETDFLPCIFGALKAGRPYVPVDRVTPPDRAAAIAGDVCPGVAVDFGGFPGRAASRVLTAEELKAILDAPPRRDVPREGWVSGEDAAYILFTSGSTGKPKGVPITAGNLDNFCRGVRPWYPREEGGVVLHQISYSFDVSGCAVYAGIGRGMTLFTVDGDMAEDLGLLFSALEKSGLTMWVSTPSFAEICVRSQRFEAALLPKLERFLFCGEVLTHSLCDKLARRFPAARVVNTYGPTEATVLVTAVEITEAMRRDSRSIPIGEAVEGVLLRLEEEPGRPAPGDSGELVILGDSVGPGYFRRPDLDAGRFFTDEITGLRGYRTGDLCSRNGNLYYYQGRVDNQLKINGFRVEVEDVEQNLTRVPGVLRAAVAPVWSGGKVEYLAAFLLLEKPDGLTNLKRSILVRREAAKFLPAYMIPRKIFAVESFPLNVNGKVDKKELVRRMEEGSL